MMTIAFSLSLAATTHAQRGDFNAGGRLVDGKSNEPVFGATVLVLSKKDSTQVTGVVTESDGVFRMKLAPGKYFLKISSIGYKTLEMDADLDGQFKFFGVIKLEEDVQQLSEVRVQGTAVRVEQKGDTTQYNAAAYKTNPDASGEDLVRKMPGITVEGGQVQAQGEQVQRVTIDGREYFGNDATTALRSLPAEVITSIQVFDRASDQAQFTGFNDGDTQKALNIVTKLGDQASHFGKVFAGYGTDGRYSLGGNYNYFKGKRRISVLGMSNNINQQNFSSEDLIGVTAGGMAGGRGGMRGGGRPGGGGNNFSVGQTAGISVTNSLGINFIDTWGEKIKISASYFVNASDNVNESIIERQFFTGEGFNQFYNENNDAYRTNLNHRFNARLEYDMDANNSFIVTPRMSFQTNSAENGMVGATITQEGQPLNNTEIDDASVNNAINLNNDILYRRKLGKVGRTLSVNLGTQINNRDGISELYSLNEFFNAIGEGREELIDQLTDTDSRSTVVSTNVTYTEPVGTKAQLSFTYRPSYTLSDSYRETNRYNEPAGQYNIIDSLLSNTFENKIVTQRAGASYRMRGDKFTASAGLDYQYLTLESQQTFPNQLEVDKPFSNLLPTAMFMYNFSKTTNMRVFYRTNTQTPSVNQLQNVVDNSNPLFLNAGNENLEQQYNHLFVTRFGTSNVDKGRTFFAFLFGSFTNNYISNSTLIARQDTVTADGIQLSRGSQLSRPVNLEGYANIRSFMTYGLPLGFLKSNLNINGGVSYIRNPGLINEEVNFANTTNMNSGLVLSSNISEKVDFTLSYSANYNLVENSLQAQLDNNYFQGVSSARLNLLPFKGIVINMDYSHLQFAGLGAEFNQQISLLNAGIGYKFLKDNNGDIRLTAYDLLNQNTSISRSVTETYIEDIQTRVLTRYFMLTFTYNIRKFGANQKMPEQQQGGWGGRPGGRPF